MKSDSLTPVHRPKCRRGKKLFTWHIDGEMLEHYGRRTLPTRMVERVEEHLLTCEACRERLDETSAFVDSITAAARRIREERLRPKTMDRSANAGVDF